MDHLNTLSDEILFEILAHLNVVDLARIGCVNKRLRSISEDNKLWEPFQPATRGVSKVEEYNQIISSEFKTATLKHRARLWRSWTKYTRKLDDIYAAEVGRHAFLQPNIFASTIKSLCIIIPNILCSFLIAPLYKAKLLALQDSPLSSIFPLFTLLNIINEQGALALFDGWYMYLLSSLVAIFTPRHSTNLRYIREVIFLLILSGVDRIQARVPFFAISLPHYALAIAVFLIQRRWYMKFFRYFRHILGNRTVDVAAFAFIWFDSVVVNCVTATHNNVFSTMYSSFTALLSFKLWSAALYSYPMRIFARVRQKLIEWCNALERKLQHNFARREFFKQVRQAKDLH